MLKPPEFTPPTDIDRIVFEALVAPDHYLRRVKSVVDFERLRELVACCYDSDQGRPAIDPIRMLKLEFLAFQYHLSDRELMAQTKVNVAFRFFLDLSLKSKLPHHTLMTYFRQRLGPDKHRDVFDALLAQAREHGLVRDRLRLKDATHVLANIAIPSTIALIGQTRRKLLDAVRPYAAERTAEEEQRADAIRTATDDLPDQERLLERVAHLRGIVAWVDGLVEQLGVPDVGDRQRAALDLALQLAHKVLADRDDPEGGDRLRSIHDPDARRAKHGDWFDGFLLDVTMDADSEMITCIDVLPGNGDEAADVVPLLKHEEATHGNDVEQVSMDGAGFRGALLRELTDPEGLNVEVIVPPTAEPERTVFESEDFELDASGEQLSCPAGQTTRHRYRNPHDTGWRFRFKGSTCAGCPLRPQCIDKPEQHTGRTVNKNDYEAEYRAARAKAQTPEFAQARQEHPKIERKLGELARWHRARRARYRGRSRLRVQALLTALVVNIKRMVKLLMPAEAAVGEGAVRAELAGTS